MRFGLLFALGLLGPQGGLLALEEMLDEESFVLALYFLFEVLDLPLLFLGLAPLLGTF